MPIDLNHIWRDAPFRHAPEDFLILAILRDAAVKDHHFIIVHFLDGRWLAIRKIDLAGLADRLTHEGRQARLDDMTLGSLLSDFAAPPLTLEVTLDEARAAADSLLTGQVVILDEQGQFLGLVAGETRRTSGLKMSEEIVDVLHSQTAPRMMAEPPDDAPAPPPAPPPPPPPPSPPPLGLLGEEETTGASGAAQFINVEVRDRTGQAFDARKQPLQLEQTYQLAVDVDLEVRAAAVASAGLDPSAFAPGEEEIELTVRLVSEDFRGRPADGKLFVPRGQKSLNEVAFYIQPLHEGPGVVNLVFLKDNNFLQVMTLKFHVGELLKVETQGRSLDSAFSLPRRDVNLTILKGGEDDYSLILTGPVAATARLPLSPLLLDHMVTQARNALLDQVIKMKIGSSFVFQEKIDIPEEIGRQAAFILADAGYRLYQGIFFGSETDTQARNMGARLREILTKNKDGYKIQIFAKRFSIPWGLLYLSEKRPKQPDDVDPELFMGLKHVVEQVPLQESLQVIDSNIDASAGLKVSLNLNTDISPVITNNILGFWQQQAQQGAANFALRKDGSQVLAALEDTTDSLEQIMYFYCHAVSRSLLEESGPKGPEASELIFSGKHSLTLAQLTADAGYDEPLPGQPLVFINACQSAELSPLFYEGFVPYFINKGARGVIGTECDTPALFADEWARRFFERLLSGNPLGEIALELRREFFFKHHNILGLLYSLYVDADTHLSK